MMPDIIRRKSHSKGIAELIFRLKNVNWNDKSKSFTLLSFQEVKQGLHHHLLILY